MQKQKGFTIIELIVVIAIIAILAAIVVVNVVGYIGKAKDAAIEANLDTIKTNALDYYAGPGSGSYAGFDGTSEFTTPASAAQSANGGTELAPSFLADKFCVSSLLASDKNKSWCIDSSGFNGQASCSSGSCIAGFSGPAGQAVIHLSSLAQSFIANNGGSSAGFCEDPNVQAYFSSMGDSGLSYNCNEQTQYNTQYYPGCGGQGIWMVIVNGTDCASSVNGFGTQGNDWQDASPGACACKK